MIEEPVFSLDPDAARVLILQAESEGRALLGLDKTQHDDAPRIVADMLNGRIDHVMRARVTETIARSHSWLPLIMPDLLAHHGMDADAALALSLVAPGRHIVVRRRTPDGVVAKFAQLAGSFGNSFVRLAPHTFWSSGHVRAAAMPDTVRAALIGEPLVRFLSHPVLDPLGLRIDDIRNHAGAGDQVELHVSRGRPHPAEEAPS